LNDESQGRNGLRPCLDPCGCENKENKKKQGKLL